MLKKRIIPCLDIKNGRTVKGTNFLELKDAGDPVELAILYSENGADELVFLDITATLEGRQTFAALVSEIAKHINIPFCVGGGVQSIEDASILLSAGADKIAVNSAAVKNPSLVDAMAKEFGSQNLVLAVDTRVMNGVDKVFINAGNTETDLETVAWTKEAQERGIGEILLTSMDHDGTKNGFAIFITEQISSRLSIPVIASGGAGAMEHFKTVFDVGKADAALAASIFHYKEVNIIDLKKYLKQQSIAVRI